MSDLTVKLNWNGGLRFTGVNAGGIETAIDGDSQSGASPVELLLEADRHRPEPRYLTNAQMSFDVWGDEVTPDKLVRAINLSISKYCSVYHSLRDDLKLQSQFRIHATGAEASGDYQVVEMAPPTSEL